MRFNYNITAIFILLVTSIFSSLEVRAWSNPEIEGLKWLTPDVIPHWELFPCDSKEWDGYQLTLVQFGDLKNGKMDKAYTPSKKIGNEGHRLVYDADKGILFSMNTPTGNQLYEVHLSEDRKTLYYDKAMDFVDKKMIPIEGGWERISWWSTRRNSNGDMDIYIFTVNESDNYRIYRVDDLDKSNL